MPEGLPSCSDIYLGVLGSGIRGRFILQASLWKGTSPTVPETKDQIFVHPRPRRTEK